MMQVTRAAFQAFASLNKQATDPKSHTLVSDFYTGIFPAPLPAIPMVDPAAFPLGITAWLFNKLVPKIHQTDEGSLESIRRSMITPRNASSWEEFEVCYDAGLKENKSRLRVLK